MQETTEAMTDVAVMLQAGAVPDSTRNEEWMAGRLNPEMWAISSPVFFPMMELFLQRTGLSMPHQCPPQSVSWLRAWLVLCHLNGTATPHTHLGRQS